MELTIKGIFWLIAIVLTGLSAGFFYAWEVSVIPGTKRIADRSYIETMQSINRAIINPAFMLIFLGSFLTQIITTVQHRGTDAVWFLLAATLIYFVGILLVTSLGNVPLNNALDALNINELSTDQIMGERNRYELRWNRLHTTRTIFAVLSFLLLLMPVLMHKEI